MKMKQIVFPEINKSAIWEVDVPAVADDQVCVKTRFSTVSAGTEQESHPGYFTHVDDMLASMNLCLGGRYSLSAMIKEIHSPIEGDAVYERLIKDRNFPTLVLFDWDKK